jgi:predicted transcriptional regulator
MIRTQIQLTDDQARQLKRLAAARGVSLARLIREAVDKVLDADSSEERWAQAQRGMGQFRSGHSDISENHDEHLSAAFSA